MLKLIGLSGSLRRGSYNSALLRAAAVLAPAGCDLRIESIRDIPLYDGDVEATRGVPEVVVRLKDAIAGSDGLVLATPEYNNGIPGVAKNAIDWLSRPASDIPLVFGGKPVAIMGASPGSFGTVLAQSAWLAVFRTLGAQLWTGGRVVVPRVASLVDAQGEIVDPDTRERLRKFVAGFAEFVRQRGIAR